MRALDVLVIAAQVGNELRSELAYSIEATPAFDQDAAQVMPRRLILRRKLDLFFCIRNLSIDDLARYLGVVFRGGGTLGRDRRVREDDEEAMGPGRIVAQVVFNHALSGGELKGTPVVELGDEVLAVRPDVVVLGVFGEDLGDEVRLGLCKLLACLRVGGDGRVVVVKEELAVVPDLVVLEVVHGDAIEPLDLVQHGEVEGGDDFEAVEPDGVVGWVHADDALGETETTRGVLLCGHDGAKVRDSCYKKKMLVKQPLLRYSIEMPSSYPRHIHLDRRSWPEHPQAQFAG